MPRAQSQRRQPAQRMPRCSYSEHGRRCPYLSESEAPPLCRAHRLALAQSGPARSPVAVIFDTVSDFLQGKPINQEATIGAIQDVASQWAGMAGNYRPDVMPGEREGAAHRRAQAGDVRPWYWNIPHRGGDGADPRARRPAAPPPPDPAIAAQQAARRVLELDPDEALSEKTIKARQRALAKRYHPDHGGSVEKMAAVNHAVDVLLASL